MAGFLGEEVPLVVVTGGAGSRRWDHGGLGCASGRLLVCVDVGVLARGDEPGLASPLRDATMLVAAGAWPRAAALCSVPGATVTDDAQRVMSGLADRGAAGGLAGAD